jgi:signal transduction histidine kinase
MVEERTRDQLLIEAGLALTSALDLDSVLERIVGLAIDITHARYGALGVLTEDGQRIERFVTEGITEEVRAKLGPLPVGHGILGLLIEERRPMRIPDITKDPRAYGFPPNHPPMRSFLGAPVLARGRVFGNIYLTEKHGADEFDEDDESAVVVLATQAGVAVENARLYEETQRAHAELSRLEVFEERERIARELHDGVIQSLFAVGMGLQGTAALARDDAISGRLADAVEEIDRAIRDLRNYIFGLRPGILADRHLDQALQTLGEEFQMQSNVVTVVAVDPSAAAEMASKAAEIVQLTREALSNVGRHAHATTCRVSLRFDTAHTGVELEIDDDGSGFDVEAPRTGMGLANLESRLQTLGGTLRIQSTAAEGTTVRAFVPL